MFHPNSGDAQPLPNSGCSMPPPNSGSMLPRHRDHVTGILFRAMWVVALVGTVIQGKSALAETRANTSPESGGSDSNKSSNTVSPNRVVVICGGFPRDEIQTIEESIFAHVADLDVKVHFYYITVLPTAPSAQEALADNLMSDTQSQSAFVVYPENSRIELKIILKSEGELETRHRTIGVAEGTPLNEALGNIVRSALAIILEEMEQKPATAATKPTTEAPPMVPNTEMDDDAAHSNTAEHRMNLATGFALGFYSEGHMPWMGMDITLGWQPFKALSFHLGYTFFSKFETETEDIKLSVIRHPVRIGIGWLKPANTFWFEAGASFLIDYSKERLFTDADNWILKNRDFGVHYSLVVYSRIAFEIFKQLHFFVRFGLEIPVSTTDYNIDTSERRIFILQSFPVQPVITTGLCIYFF